MKLETAFECIRILLKRNKVSKQVVINVSPEGDVIFDIKEFYKKEDDLVTSEITE